MPDWTITIETKRLGETAELADFLERFAAAAEAGFGDFGPAAAIHDGALALTLTIGGPDAHTSIIGALHRFTQAWNGTWHGETPPGFIHRIEAEYAGDEAAAA